VSLFVLGTDTGAGKTVVSAVLLARYGGRLRLGYWKPIATGAAEERDRDSIRRWAGHLAQVLPETYLFAPPLSPHLAARLAGRAIDPDRVLEDLVRHGAADLRRSLVIEGAGGLLVPLTESGYLLADLARDLHLPCLLVARSTLGTINHTLLALEAMRSRSLPLAGVVLSGPPNPENRAAIERFGAVRVVGEVGALGRPGRASIARAARSFDRRGALRKYLA
jgi:malonyl-CoA O-methyltransferase